MARPIYNYELNDPDLSWLVSNFQENNPKYILIESAGLPVMFILAGEAKPESNYPVPVKDEDSKNSDLPETK